MVGHVAEVTPSIVTVELDIEAPHGTSINHGVLQRFPSVNGFVALPCEAGVILAIVLWLGIVDNPAIARSRQDAGVLGLPTAGRRLRAMALGLVRRDSNGVLALERGALTFPTVGDPVRLPTGSEAALAVPLLATGGLRLGTAPMAGDRPVVLSPNRLFGRHLAILGNTGSGKSCSLAHLLRTSATLATKSGGTFRAIILDLNGEYGQTFSDLEEAIPIKRYTVEPDPDGNVATLRVPYWLWSFREWSAFAAASGRSQAPVLRQALHILRTSAYGGVSEGVVTVVAGRRIILQFKSERVPTRDITAKLSELERIMQSCKAVHEASGGEGADELRALYAALKTMLDPKRSSDQRYKWALGVAGPSVEECRNLLSTFDSSLEALGVPSMVGDVSSVDTPTPFNALDLVQLIELIGVDAGADVASWVAPMQDRLTVAMSDRRMGSVCGYLDEESLESWIDSLIGASASGQISVLDLSLIPAQAQHVIASVIARSVLEVLERGRRVDGATPVILAIEEAHALVRRRTDTSLDEVSVGMADLCREAFERIGREGRKFGLSLVVSSQRPSELSETVLSQCNTFLVHRIVNARDQDLIRRLVPDSLGDLVSEVSAYPARTALLLGAAAEIPVLVEVEELDERFRPNASDPDFEAAWKNGASFDAAKLASVWASQQRDDPATFKQLEEEPPPF
jgi:DNA helicase HerA-like ATPase